MNRFFLWLSGISLIAGFVFIEADQEHASQPLNFDFQAFFTQHLPLQIQERKNSSRVVNIENKGSQTIKGDEQTHGDILTKQTDEEKNLFVYVDYLSFLEQIILQVEKSLESVGQPIEQIGAAYEYKVIENTFTTENTLTTENNDSTEPATQEVLESSNFDFKTASTGTIPSEEESAKEAADEMKLPVEDLDTASIENEDKQTQSHNLIEQTIEETPDHSSYLDFDLDVQVLNQPSSSQIEESVDEITLPVEDFDTASIENEDKQTQSNNLIEQTIEETPDHSSDLDFDLDVQVLNQPSSSQIEESVEEITLPVEELDTASIENEDKQTQSYNLTEQTIEETPDHSSDLDFDFDFQVLNQPPSSQIEGLAEETKQPIVELETAPTLDVAPTGDDLNFTRSIVLLWEEIQEKTGQFINFAFHTPFMPSGSSENESKEEIKLPVVELETASVENKDKQIQDNILIEQTRQETSAQSLDSNSQVLTKNASLLNPDSSSVIVETKEEQEKPEAEIDTSPAENEDIQVGNENNQTDGNAPKIDREVKQKSTMPAEKVRVILTPLNRTILSAQISTPILSSQVSAPVTKIYKRMGETFKTGDPLIEIDRTIFLANLEKAQTALLRAETIYRARQQSYEDMISSLTELREAQAMLANAKAELALAQNQYDWALIRAPYDGRVFNLLIEEFELPQPGQALIEVIQDNIIVAKALAPEGLLPKLYIGKVIQVEIPSIGKTVDAKIVRIGAMIDPSSETIPFEAEIDNSEFKLIPGMAGFARIE